MKIYTLFYEDTGLFNRSVFVMPNDAAAKKAMKLNLMDPKAENFRNEAKLGHTYLYALTNFEEEKGVTEMYLKGIEANICNLKDLLDDDTGNLPVDDK